MHKPNDQKCVVCGAFCNVFASTAGFARETNAKPAQVLGLLAESDTLVFTEAGVRCVSGSAPAAFHREAAVAVSQHLFGLETGQQAPPNKGAQDAPTQGGLHLGCGIRAHAGGRVEDDFRR